MFNRDLLESSLCSPSLAYCWVCGRLPLSLRRWFPISALPLRPGTKLVDIYYDLSDADGDLQLVQVAASSDAGLIYFYNGSSEPYQTGTTGFHPTYATGS